MIVHCCIAVVLSGSPAVAQKPGGDGPAKTIDDSTPQKLTESFLKAMRAKDWKTGFACVTPESRDLMNGMFALMAHPVIARDKQRRLEFRELLEDHGVETASTVTLTSFGFFMKDQGRTFKRVKQKTKLFGALDAWTQKRFPRARDGKPVHAVAPIIAGVTLADFKVRGKQATARVMRNGRYANVVIDFRQSHGKWRADFVASFRRIVGPAVRPARKPPRRVRKTR